MPGHHFILHTALYNCLDCNLILKSSNLPELECFLGSRQPDSHAGREMDTCLLSKWLITAGRNIKDYLPNFHLFHVWRYFVSQEFKVNAGLRVRMVYLYHELNYGISNPFQPEYGHRWLLSLTYRLNRYWCYSYFLTLGNNNNHPGDWYVCFTQRHLWTRGCKNFFSA